MLLALQEKALTALLAAGQICWLAVLSSQASGKAGLEGKKDFGGKEKEWQGEKIKNLHLEDEKGPRKDQESTAT